LIRKLRALPFPVIAAVNGIAAGAGANLALACDLVLAARSASFVAAFIRIGANLPPPCPSVLAARSASFVEPFIRIGLVPDCGGTWTLKRLIGPARARALALTGEPLPAEKAEAWGLIWKCVDDEE